MEGAPGRPSPPRRRGTLTGRMRSSLSAGVLLLLCAACSRPYSSPLLGLEYEPPSGMALVGEEQGPPAVARFGRGLTLYSVPGLTLAADAPPEEVLQAAGLEVAGTRMSARTGSVAAGPVGRYEYKAADGRTLVYYLPLQDRGVLVHFRAPEQEYGALSAQVERSLGALKRRQ
jgi:hypothetical protein